MAKVFTAQPAEGGGWWATCPELPVTTEAETLEALVDRAAAVAPEIAELNGLAAPGARISLRFVTEREILVAAA